MGLKIVEREAGMRRPVKTERGTWNRPWRTGDVVNLMRDCIEWMKDEENVWWKDFFNDLGITVKFVYGWVDKSKEVAELLELVKEKQESKFLKGGLKGTLHSKVSTFALKAVSGWRDKDEQTKNHYNLIIAKKDLELDRARAMSKWVKGEVVEELKEISDGEVA